MKIAFIDESGSPAPADGRRFFIVAALVTDSSRAIELHVKRTRRSLQLHSPLSELKAAHSQPTVIKRFLTAIGQEPNHIYAVVVDKQGAKPAQSELIYHWAIGQLILHAVREHPNLHIYLDKRYTNRRQRLELEETIRQMIADVPRQIVVIEQVDSTAYPGLQAVDFVAWALAHKHETGNTWAASLIAHQVVVEEINVAKKLAARPGSR